MNIPSKLPEIKESIFSVMGQMAVQYNAINLSQGFPNFDMDPVLTALVDKAMADGFNQYAPMPGTLELRNVISKKILSEHRRIYNPETEITLTAGATQAIFTIMAATLKKDDEVIIFTPAYDCYAPTIGLFGAKVVAVQMRPPHFEIPWHEVKEKVNSKTKMIVINSPHNPTGRIVTKEDLMQLEEIAEENNLLVLSDEVYEHMVFDKEKHLSVAQFEHLSRRSFITASFGKTFHNTGWKMGYCVAPSALMEEFRKVHQFVVFCVNHPIQKALETYLKDEENYKHLCDLYQRKRDLFLKFMSSSNFKMTPSKGTYFQLLDYSEISDLDDISFAERLLKVHGVATIPTSVFNKNGEDFKQIRVCFAKTDNTLEQAAAVLNKISKDNF